DVLVVAVDDTGPGMTEEQATILFQPFSQADNSVTRKHGGTGLGLTICRRLAELMGGSVELVTTAPGRGSRFELRIPLHAAPGAASIARLEYRAPSPSVAEPMPHALAGRRILLAEDGEDNQRLISVLLKAAGAEVTIVANGRQALDAIEWAEAGGAAFELLLTDMQMPEVDGYTLASVLRANGSVIPIIALTAHAMAEDRQKCLDAGCDDYVSKPIDRRALIATCARWLSPPDVFTTLGETLTNTSAAVDAHVPERLISELANDPELAELSQVFASLLPARVEAINAMLLSLDMDGAARLTHQLKGAAGSYGFPLISELARRVEVALGNDDHSIDPLMTRLQAYADAAARGVAAESGAGA
uniref:response regulator n=1 Tax=Gemmatimonas sp. TaxID=1962908 RepID=UPI00333FCC32